MVNGFKFTNRCLVSSNDSLSWLSFTKDIKLVKVLIYLFNNQVVSSNTVRFTLNDMIVSCGYKPNRHKDCINDKFKSLLNVLIELGAISSNINFVNVKPNDFLSVEFTAIPINCDGLEFGYTYCPYYAFDKMLSANVDFDNYYLVMVYLYISSRINNNDGIHAVGGKAECCYFKYETICNDLSISNSLYHKYISSLKELGLIDYKNIGKVKDKYNNTFVANNVYVLTSTKDYKYHLAQGLKESTYYYENELGYEVIG